MHHVRLKILLVAALVVVGLIANACGGDDDSGGAQKNQVVKAKGGKVTVDAHDLYFNAKEIDASAGALSITLDNQGAVLHTFVIDGQDFKIAAGAGKSTTKSANLRAGTYQYFCDVPGHRATMHGSLVVT
jgi:plastocyanin